MSWQQFEIGSALRASYCSRGRTLHKVLINIDRPFLRRKLRFRCLQFGLLPCIKCTLAMYEFLREVEMAGSGTLSSQCCLYTVREFWSCR